MVLSLLCETEDKIFISQLLCVNIREEILQLSQCGVNRAPRRALRPNLPLRLSVCVHMLMSVAPHAERRVQRQTAMKTDGRKEKKRIKTDGDISRLTVLDIKSCAVRRGPHFATTYLSKRSRHLCLKWARKANWRLARTPIAV